MRIQFKILIILLLFIGLSSCTTYYKSSVTLEQAANEKSKVKVETTSNKVMKYQQVVNENGTFYGVKTNDDKQPLNESEIKSVQLHDKTGSTGDSILAAIGITLSLLTLAVISWF